MSAPTFIDSIDAAVDHLLDTLPGDIVLGIPLGVGKPNPLVNALYRRHLSSLRQLRRIPQRRRQPTRRRAITRRHREKTTNSPKAKWGQTKQLVAAKQKQ